MCTVKSLFLEWTHRYCKTKSLWNPAEYSWFITPNDDELLLCNFKTTVIEKLMSSSFSTTTPVSYQPPSPIIWELCVKLVTHSITSWVYGCLSGLRDWPQCSSDVVRQAGYKGEAVGRDSRSEIESEKASFLRGISIWSCLLPFLFLRRRGWVTKTGERTEAETEWRQRDSQGVDGATSPPGLQLSSV